MHKEYTCDKKIRRQDLRSWLNTQRGWKIAFGIALVLYTLSILILIMSIAGMALLTDEPSGNNAMPFWLVGVFLGIATGCIPFVIGNGIHNGFKKKYGYPYINEIDNALVLDDKGLIYIYRNTGNNYDKAFYGKENRDVYTIDYEKLARVWYNKKTHVCTCIGEGSLTAYDDYAAGRINYENSQRRFYPNSDFSFMISFKEREEILEQLSLLTHVSYNEL